MKIRVIYTRTIPAMLVFLTFILNGCTWLFYDRYKVYEDEFTNSTKSIARMELRPLERKTEIGNAHIIFERTKSLRSDKYEAYCVVARSSSSFTAEQRGFMKIDGTNYEINIGNITSEQKMSTETTASAYTTSDSTSITTGTYTDTDTRLWIDDKFKFSLTAQMLESLRTSGELILRFYFGPIPATYRIKGYDLMFLKKAMADQNI